MDAPTRRYPWADWFNAGTVTLRKGVDYDGRTYAMAQQVRNAASRLGFMVSLVIDEEDRSVLIRVVSRKTV